MSEQEDKRSKTENPPSREEIVSRIHSKSEAIIQFCIQGVETNFYKSEQSLRTQIYQLACLYLELYLWSLQERFDYPYWLKTGLYYQGQLWGVQIALQPLTGFWIHDVKAASPISGGPVSSMSIRSF